MAIRHNEVAVLFHAILSPHPANQAARFLAFLAGDPGS